MKLLIGITLLLVVALTVVDAHVFGPSKDPK